MLCCACASSALNPIPFDRFSTEICDIYRAGSQPATVAKMEQILGEFGEYCPSTADVNLHAISRWLGSSACRRRSLMTRRSLLSSFRAACALGAREHYLANPFLAWDLDRWLPAPDPEDLDRPWLARSGAEISRVLRRARCEALGGGRRARRTERLVRILAYTGARAKEVLGARRDDFDLEAGLFRIRPNPRRKLKTRGSRRDLPLHPELLGFLKRDLADCGEWLIAQRSGRGPWFHGSPGYRPLDVVQQLGERCAVDGLTLASFRHTFATLAEGWGMSELQIQRWLGHKRPQTQVWYRRRRPSVLVETVGLIQY
jgi:integrase